MTRHAPGAPKKQTLSPKSKQLFRTLRMEMNNALNQDNNYKTPLASPRNNKPRSPPGAPMKKTKK